jgi:ParB family transcriptional regulator, chromosome partitioning protein
MTDLITAETDVDAPAPPPAAALMRRGAIHQLPLLGDGMVAIRPQVRSHDSDALTAAGLQQLKESLASVGQLQPVIVEDDPDTGPVLIAGERRVRALTLAHDEGIESPHLDGTVTALVIPGPLTQWQRWSLQISENVARSDLTATELGKALWTARAVLFAERLEAKGADLPDVDEIEDPSKRWEALNEFRTAEGGPLYHCGVEWAEVVAYLRLPISATTARDRAAHFRDLGEEVSSQLEGVPVDARAAAAAMAATRGNADVAALMEKAEQAGFGGADGSKVLEEAFGLGKEHPDWDVDQVMDKAKPIAPEPVERDEPVDVDLLGKRVQGAQAAVEAVRSAVASMEDAVEIIDRIGRMPEGSRDTGSLRLLCEQLDGLIEELGSRLC